MTVRAGAGVLGTVGEADPLGWLSSLPTGSVVFSAVWVSLRRSSVLPEASEGAGKDTANQGVT